MDSKTVKVIGAVAIALLVMIIVVIYTPKPTTQPTKNKQTLPERLNEDFQRIEKESAHLKLTTDAIQKVLKAIQTANQKVEHLSDNFTEAIKVVRVLLQETKRVNNAKLQHELVTAISKAVTAIEVLQGIDKTKKAADGSTQPENNEKEQYQSSIQILNEAIEAVNTLEKAINAHNDQTHTLNVEEAQYTTLIEPTNELIKTLEEINKGIKENIKEIIEMNTEASDALTAATEEIKRTT